MQTLPWITWYPDATTRLVWVRRCLLLLLTVSVGANLAAQEARETNSRPPVILAALPVTPVNYVVSPNDLLSVKVFQEDDMDWTVRVNKDGNIVLPLVGLINATKRTPEELAAVVRDRLHDGWLVHPQVSVGVLEFSKRRFTILGQVEKSGQIDFPDNTALNVLQAIGMAGGYTSNADPGRVYVKRQVGNKQIVLKMDARRMARNASATPFEILPGDTITVGETIF